jgi:hypothetical protein
MSEVKVPNRIVIAFGHNRNELWFNLTRLVAMPPSHPYVFYVANEDALKSLSPEVDAQIRELFGVPGVVQVELTPYAIKVVKGEAFYWEEVQPRIVAILEANFGPFEESFDWTEEKNKQAQAG